MSSKTDSPATPILQWVSFPLLDYGKKSIALAVLIFAIPMLVFVGGFGVNWSVFAFLLLFLSMFPYFIKTKYCVYEKEILVVYAGLFKVHNPIEKFRCFYSDQRGMQLGTMSQPSRLDRFRGLSMRFSKNQQEKKMLEKLLQDKQLQKF